MDDQITSAIGGIVIILPGQPHIGKTDVRSKEKGVLSTCIIIPANHILTISLIKDKGIIASTSFKRIVTGSTGKDIIASATINGVITCTSQYTIIAIPTI